MQQESRLELPVTTASKVDRDRLSTEKRLVVFESHSLFRNLHFEGNFTNELAKDTLRRRCHIRLVLDF